MSIFIKRAYDSVEKSDGYRVLVDRLWPRGVTKVSAEIDLWAKDVTPSNELRSWFHADTESRFKEFSKKYAAEIKDSQALQDLEKEIKSRKTVTLVTAVKNIERSHIPTLLAQLG